MKGIGVDKNIEKAKETFEIGVERNDLYSLYHLAFILEESNLKHALELFKRSSDQGYAYSQLKYAEIVLKTDTYNSFKQSCPTSCKNWSVISPEVIKFIISAIIMFISNGDAPEHNVKNAPIPNIHFLDINL